MRSIAWQAQNVDEAFRGHAYVDDDSYDTRFGDAHYARSAGEASETPAAG
jgi:hypothetical protein